MPQTPQSAPPVTEKSAPEPSDGTGGELALHLVAANARLNAIALVTAVALIVLGVWVYFGIQDSLRELRATGLQTMLDANAQMLQLWIDDRKADAERWARDARLTREVENLVAVTRGGDASPSVLLQAPAQRALQALLTGGLKEGGGAKFQLIDTRGVIIASPQEADVGRRLGVQEFPPQLAEVFRGAPRFGRSDSGGTTSAQGARFELWAYVAVRDAAGRVIAALGFAHRAGGQFTGIFEVVRPGKSGETYAFDANGVMLSRSRFADDVARFGLATRGRGEATVGVAVRDPGGDLLAGYQPELELAARPLTRIAALAIASRGKDAADDRTGVIVEAYRNYLGVPSVGAWRWLAEYDLGVAIEMSAAEAYAPLRYLNLAFSIILGLLLLTLAAVLWSAVYVKRLRRAVGDARLIGQYRVEREIGEGGMAKVYLVRHPRLQRASALKMLKPHIASEEVIERFEREVQLASQLDHPSTIQIYDYGRTREGSFYYVMEYLDGVSLGRLVADYGRMPIGRAVYVLRQVCAALREAHGRGLIHRDVKPHNIMLCQRGGEFDVVKILDFGLVKDLEGSESRDITQFQKVLGTPLYMSPERIRNPGDADARSDIYSVGAVGFYLITGRDLFEAGSDHDLTYHILHTVPPRLTELIPDVPRRLDDLIARCLAKDRSERPHDVLVVMALLDAASVDHPWSQRDAEQWWRRHRSADDVAGSRDHREADALPLSKRKR